MKPFYLCLLLVLFCGVAKADEKQPVSAYETSAITVSGFGTLGAVYNDKNNVAPFVRTNDQVGEPHKDFLWKPDTRLGVQVAYRPNPQLEFVGQAVYRDQYEWDIDKSISRAYVAYQVSPNVRVRLGRIGDATYMMSDYLDAGYAYPWVRPPETMYGFIPIHHFNGGDINYTIQHERSSSRFKLMVGTFKSDLYIAKGQKSRDLSSLGPYAQAFLDTKSYPMDSQGPLVGATFIHEYQAFKLWLGYSSFKLANDPPIAPALRSSLDQFAAVPGNPYASEAKNLSDAWQFVGRRVGYASIGANYDDGQWMVQSEFARASSDQILIDMKQGYVSVGRNFGSLMPYGVFGFVIPKDSIKAQNRWGALGPRFGVLQTAAIGAINLNMQDPKREMALGFRWDFNSRAALKMQWNHIRFLEPDRVSNMGFGGRLPNRVNVFSAVIDFVF